MPPGQYGDGSVLVSAGVGPMTAPPTSALLFATPHLPFGETLLSPSSSAPAGRLAYGFADEAICRLRLCRRSLEAIVGQSAARPVTSVPRRYGFGYGRRLPLIAAHCRPFWRD